MILSRGHKLRYVNQFVGAFFLLVLALLLVGSVLMIRSKDWFAPREPIVAYLPEEELNGLQVGTPVQILGERVGKVVDIRYETEDLERLRDRWQALGSMPEHFLRIDIELLSNALERLGTRQARIHVRRRMAGVGDVYLELMRGHAPVATPVTPDEQAEFYVIQPEKSAQDEIRTMTHLLGQVQADFAVMRSELEQSSAQFAVSNERFQTTSQSIQTLADNWTDITPQLVADLKQTTSDFRDTTANFRDTSSQIRETSTQIRETNQQIRDTTSQIADSNHQLQDVLTDVQAASPRLLPITQQTEQLLQTSQVVADRLKQESESLPGTVRQVRSTVENADDTVQEAQEVIDGLRQNWLIRRNVPPRQTPERLPASQIRVGGF